MQSRVSWSREAKGLFLGAVILCCTFAARAEASHFRFAHNTWSRVSGNTVEFTSTQAWRSTAPDLLAIDFGDGSVPSAGPTTIVGNFTDFAGEGYQIVQYKVQHTYASEGPYTAFSSSCCRISTLINAADQSERIETVVDLRNANQGSPVSSIPVIVQMVQGGVNNASLPTADPDLDPLSCRMATAAESLIPVVATAGGNTLSVSPGCVLTWDTSGTAIGQKYAAQVIIEETHAGNPSRVALDFIIEIVGGTLGQPPACGGLSGQQVVNVGQPFAATFTGTDPDGDDLTVAHLGLPPGATLTPPSGTTQSQPFAADFNWTPQPSDAGTAYAVTIVFTDTTGFQATCAFSISVPLCGDGIVDPPAEQCDPNAPPSCGAGEVCTSSCLCAVPTDTPTSTPTLTPTPQAPTPTPTLSHTPVSFGCESAPMDQSFCKQVLKAGRSQLRIWDHDDDARDRIDWQWRRGETTAMGEMGDPTADTSYAFCLYDGGDNLIFSASIPAGLEWRVRGNSILKYVDNPSQAQGGIRRFKLTARGNKPENASIRLTGRGQNDNLGNTTPLGNFPDLGGFPIVTAPGRVRAQLVNSDGVCWESQYQSRIAKNGASNARLRRFKAGNDVP